MVMKEVKAGCYAGPYETIPYTNFIQSPIGLVPKAGNKTRLIFHLSYQFKDGKGSVNSCTPRDICTVKYNDLDAVVAACLCICNYTQDSGLPQIIFLGKTDLSSAFRVLPLQKKNVTAGS